MATQYDGMPLARETVTLSFSRVRQEYVIQNAQGDGLGTVSAGYDIKANQII